MFDFSGLRALVTGATSGIGLAIADALAERGAGVLRHGLEGADPGLGVDLGEDGAARRLAAAALESGPVDILVLSASLQVRAPWEQLREADFERQLRINLTASFELLKAVVPGMRERGFGRVLMLGSVQQHRPHPDMIAYAASKAAQANLMRNLARQLAPHGITVNSLSPGVVDTPRNADALADPAYLERIVSGIPAARIGVPADCTAAALLLCSHEGSYITGQDLAVDGGMSL